MARAKKRSRGVVLKTKATRSESFISVYANHTNSEVTPFDFKLIFGQLGSPNGGSIEVIQSVAIVMSPQHYKALFELLQKTIANYEKSHGKIPLVMKS